MKKFINIFYFSLFFTSVAYSQSSIVFSAGTNLDIGSGADVCADAIGINGTYSGSGTMCQGPLPVIISSFNSAVSKNDVTLDWVTQTEMNNSGFEVQRKITVDTNWKVTGFVRGNGTTNHANNYSFLDKNLHKASYQYRLKQIDYNGNYEYYYMKSNVSISGPKDFGVSQNYPNPSNPKSKIDYQLLYDCKVLIKVYDMIGKEVATLVNEFQTADFYSVVFDGTNIASGVYFYRIILEGNGQKFTKSMKMVLVK